MCKLNYSIMEFRNPGNTILIQKSNIKKAFIDKYNEYKKYFKDMYFYTFDKTDIQKINFPYLKNTLYNKYNLHSIIYAFFTPLLHYKTLKKVDCYFALQLPSSLYPLYCSLFFKNKIVIVFWNFDWGSKEWLKDKNFFYKLFVKTWIFITLKFINNYVAVTENEKQKILTLKPNANVLVLPTSVNTSYYKDLNIHRKERSLIFTGRLEYQKNLINLFIAISKIDNCELHILGEGSLKNELMKINEKLNINVFFYGKLNSDDVIKMLNSHSIFILPSFYEGISNSLVEAISCKIPVIVSNIQTNKEIIKDKETGLLCSTDPQSIKTAIEYAFANPDKMKIYAENAYKKIHKNYSLNNYCNKIAEYVEKITTNL